MGISNSVLIPSNFLSFFPIIKNEVPFFTLFLCHSRFCTSTGFQDIRTSSTSRQTMPQKMLRFAVCGTDLVTYFNRCYLDIAICMARNRGRVLACKHNGECTRAEKQARKGHNVWPGHLRTGMNSRGYYGC